MRNVSKIQFLNENKNIESKFENERFKDTEDIIDWLDDNNISNFTINKDLSCNINEDIEIYDFQGEFLPIKINKLNGGIVFEGTSKFKSFIGFPNVITKYIRLRNLGVENFEYLCADLTTCDEIEVNNFAHLTSVKGIGDYTGSLTLEHCNNLSSLDDMPQNLTSLSFNYCNGLTSLRGLQKEINTFSVIHCDSLPNLKFCPAIKHSLVVSKCKNIKTLKGVTIMSLNAIDGLMVTTNYLSWTDVKFTFNLSDNIMFLPYNIMKYLKLCITNEIDSIWMEAVKRELKNTKKDNNNHNYLLLNTIVNDLIDLTN